MILNKDFYQQDTIKVAQELLGTILQVKTPAGITTSKIVETEAYLHNDPACHSFKGENLRNSAMFQEGGTVYVYLIYGVHFCFNVVTNKIGLGEAVLIRAVEPITGIELMKKRRRLETPQQLTNGPAKLVQAQGITILHNNSSLITGPIQILEPEEKTDFEIVTTKRVGITKARDLPLRFYIKDNLFVSKK